MHSSGSALSPTGPVGTAGSMVATAGSMVGTTGNLISGTGKMVGTTGNSISTSGSFVGATGSTAIPCGTCGPNEECDGTGHCILVLASGLKAPANIAVDATDVYWLDAYLPPVMAGTPPSYQAAGSVMKCAIGGCGNAPTTIAAGQALPEVIALDDTSVYWGVNPGMAGSAALMRCAKSACSTTQTKLMTGAPTGIAIDAAHLYWLVPGNTIDIVGSVWSCNVPDCVPQLLTTVKGWPSSLVVAASTLVWAEEDGPGSLLSCTPSSCMPTALASGLPQRPASVAADAQSVYWHDGAGSVLTCPIHGCNGLPRALLSGPSFYGAIATDGVNVYVAGAPMGTPGAVIKCSVGGCSNKPTILAAGPAIRSPFAIAVDATYVYWTDFIAKTVMRAAK